MPLTIVARRYGVRAEGMALLSVVWTLIGVGIITGSAPNHVPGAFHTLIPGWIRVAGWVGTAAFALVTSTSPHRSSLGLGALTIMPSLQATSHVGSWVIWVLPDSWTGGAAGNPGGWYSALFYVAMLMLVKFVSHIASDTRPPLERLGNVPAPGGDADAS